MNDVQIAKLDAAIAGFNTEITSLLQNSQCDENTKALVEEASKQTYYALKAFRDTLTTN